MDEKRRVTCIVLFAPLVLALVDPVPQADGADQSAGSGQHVFEPGDVYLAGSRSFIHVYKSGLGHEHGVEGQLKAGHIDLNAAEPGELVFDMTSFNADTNAARKYVGLEGTTDATTRKQVNANMLGSAVLDVRHYPEARFKIKSVSQVQGRGGQPQYHLKGTFTLHGVSRDIQVVATTEDKDLWTHLRGRFSIQQTDYGITPFSKAFGAIGVADRLDIYGDLWIARQRLQAPAANSH